MGSNSTINSNRNVKSTLKANTSSNQKAATSNPTASASGKSQTATPKTQSPDRLLNEGSPGTNKHPSSTAGGTINATTTSKTQSNVGSLKSTASQASKTSSIDTSSCGPSIACMLQKMSSENRSALLPDASPSTVVPQTQNAAQRTQANNISSANINASVALGSLGGMFMQSYQAHGQATGDWSIKGWLKDGLKGRSKGFFFDPNDPKGGGSGGINKDDPKKPPGGLGNKSVEKKGKNDQKTEVPGANNEQTSATPSNPLQDFANKAKENLPAIGAGILAGVGTAVAAPEEMTVTTGMYLDNLLNVVNGQKPPDQA